MDHSLHAVLCAVHSSYIHSALAPWYLLAAAGKTCDTGITVEVAEYTVNMDIREAARGLLGKNPDVVGFSCYIWNITAVKVLTRQIKNVKPQTTIIWGGPEVSYNAAKRLASAQGPDYILSGEGEEPFALLLNALYRGGDVEGIPGLCYRKDEQIVTAPPHRSEQDPPSPYVPVYFETLRGRIAYLETSRGCPFQCAFCLSGRGGSVRFFDLERSKRELVLLSCSGTQTVKLVDRTFNCNRTRALELFRFIIENHGISIQEGVCFHFEIAGDLLDAETIRLLQTAPPGLIQLEIGLQSFHEKALCAVRRQTDIPLLKQNIGRLVSAENIHIHLDLIAGLPFEDFAAFGHSFDTAYRLRPHMLQLGFLKLLPGAPMREEKDVFHCSYSNDPPYKVTGTPWLNGEELRKLHHVEDALGRLYNSGRFRRTLDYVLMTAGLTPFQLFLRFGTYAAQKGAEGISLDDYTALALTFFRQLDGIDPAVLEDNMICDRLSTNASGRLPPALAQRGKTMKHVVNLLLEDKRMRPEKGVRRGYALLRSENSLVWADYSEKSPVTGTYPLYLFCPATKQISVQETVLFQKRG